VNSFHDSYTALGGMVPIANMMLGEVAPGGTGSGLYGMLVLAVITVFVAGLMVGRTPEYVGKKIRSREIKFASLYFLVTPILVLVGTAAAMASSSARASMLNTGPHGLSEVLYAYTSASNNNGSAFAGISVNTVWYNTSLGLAMLFGRFFRSCLCWVWPVHSEPRANPRSLPGPCEPINPCSSDACRSDDHLGRPNLPACAGARTARGGTQMSSDRSTVLPSSEPASTTDGAAKQRSTSAARRVGAWAARPQTVVAILPDALRKLDPRTLWRNPVMFVVEIGSIFTTVLAVLQPSLFAWAITIWLWLTVLFANLAEAVAEGRGKAQAATLRRARQETAARRLLDWSPVRPVWKRKRPGQRPPARRCGRR
jgi:hypothetical protein